MQFFPQYIISEDIEADIKDLTLAELYGIEYYKDFVNSTSHFSYSCSDLELAYSEIANFDERGHSLKQIRKKSMIFKPKGNRHVYKLAKGPVELEKDYNYIDVSIQDNTLGSQVSKFNSFLDTTLDKEKTVDKDNEDIGNESKLKNSLKNIKGITQIPKKRKIKELNEVKKSPLQNNNNEDVNFVIGNREKNRPNKVQGEYYGKEMDQTTSLSEMFNSMDDSSKYDQKYTNLRHRANNKIKEDMETMKSENNEKNTSSRRSVNAQKRRQTTDSNNNEMQQLQNSAGENISGKKVNENNNNKIENDVLNVGTRNDNKNIVQISSNNETMTNPASSPITSSISIQKEILQRIETDPLTILQTICNHAPFLSCYPLSFNTLGMHVKQNISFMTMSNAYILRYVIDHETSPKALINIRASKDNIVPDAYIEGLMDNDKSKTIINISQSIIEYTDALISRLLALSVNEKYISKVTEPIQAKSFALVSSNNVRDVLKYNKFVRVSVPLSEEVLKKIGKEYGSINIFKLLPNVILHVVLNDLEGMVNKTKNLRNNIADLIVRGSKMRNCCRYLSYSFSQLFKQGESYTPQQFIDTFFSATGPGNIKTSDLLLLDYNSMSMSDWHLGSWFNMMKTVYKQLENYITLRKKIVIAQDTLIPPVDSPIKLLYEILEDYATRTCLKDWDEHCGNLLLFLIENLKV